MGDLLKPVGACLTHHATQTPASPALTCDGKTHTFAQLDALANRTARAYIELVPEGLYDTIVTIMLPNSVELIAATFAVWKLGATPQCISFRMPVIERDGILDLSRPRLIIGAQIPGRKCVPVGFVPPAHLSDAPLAEVTSPHLKAPTSGGSTGRPKVILSTSKGEFDPHGSFNFGETRTVLVAGPCFHNYPFMWATIGVMTGRHVVLMRRFDALETLRLVEAHRVEYLALVPAMMTRIWKLGEAARRRYDLRSLTIVFHVAAPCPAWLKEAFIGWLGADTIHELYGATEGQGASYITGSEWLTHRGSVGRMMPGTEASPASRTHLLIRVAAQGCSIHLRVLNLSS
jgi:bile acid-coenzyme A ligase